MVRRFDFVEALEDTRQDSAQEIRIGDNGPDEPPIVEHTPTLWPRRSAQFNLRYH